MTSTNASFATRCTMRIVLGLLFASLLSCRDSILLPSIAGAYLAAPAEAGGMRRCHDEHLAEAGYGLAAIVTAEQVAFQRNGGASYIAASGSAEIGSRLGLDLESLDDRWFFEIGDVSSQGFVASALGRPRTSVWGLRVVLSYERNSEPAWTVEGCRPKSKRTASRL